MNLIITFNIKVKTSRKIIFVIQAGHTFSTRRVMTDMKTVKVERWQVRCNKDRVSSTEGRIEDLFQGLISLMTTQKSNDYVLDKKINTVSFQLLIHFLNQF